MAVPHRDLCSYSLERNCTVPQPQPYRIATATVPYRTVICVATASNATVPHRTVICVATASSATVQYRKCNRTVSQPQPYRNVFRMTHGRETFAVHYGTSTPTLVAVAAYGMAGHSRQVDIVMFKMLLTFFVELFYSLDDLVTHTVSGDPNVLQLFM